ncbi:hypothetical protein E0F88_25410 [Dyadobacter psychrotolerans]|uniref:Uncharacterized protein n=2 Tax=Dyadobacter psychrotolerans TaxID=2541721 RepID=A0A4R5DC16_9BACT|nr:hypothetical protein E0F88_25410 [Dyadobacter psychrotolerans]
MDTVNLMFHTAASSLTLTEDAVKKMSSLVFDRTDSVKSWGGNENTSRFSKKNTLQIGNRQWEHVSIWENMNSGPQTGGKFGIDLFEGKSIEIDFDKKVIVLHPKLPGKARRFEKLKLIYENEMMFVEAGCEVGGKLLVNRFLIHSGYSGSVLLDDQFTAVNKIDGQLKIVDQKALKDSFGNILMTKKAVLPSFKLGSKHMTNIPVGFFTGALGRQKMSIIGGDLLKRFNMIIDTERANIYLQESKLKNSEYYRG